ncbi:hypothetical protein HDV00_012410 [Rhizophlyctis rosea]|nr:hypothetical protein HDV00_012410 [Rhizophlyctis rosea]
MADVATAPTTYHERSYSQYDSTVTDFQPEEVEDDYGYDDEFEQENIGREIDEDQAENQYYPNDDNIGDDDDDGRPPSRASQVLARAAQALENQISQAVRSTSMESMDGLRRKFVSQPALSDPELFNGDGREWKGEEGGDGREGRESSQGKGSVLSRQGSLQGILKSGGSSRRGSAGNALNGVHFNDYGDEHAGSLRSGGKRVSIAEGVVTEVHEAAGTENGGSEPVPRHSTSSTKGQQSRQSSFKKSKPNSSNAILGQPIKETSPLASSGGSQRGSTAPKHVSIGDVHPVTAAISRKATAPSSKSNPHSQKQSTAPTPRKVASTTVSHHGSKYNLATAHPPTLPSSKRSSVAKLRSPPPLSLPPSPRPSNPSLPPRPQSRKGSQFITEGEGELLEPQKEPGAELSNDNAASGEQEYLQDQVSMKPEEYNEAEPAEDRELELEEGEDQTPSRQGSRASSARSLGVDGSEANATLGEGESEGQTASAAESDAGARPASGGPRRVRKMYKPGVHITGIEFRRLPQVEKMAEKLAEVREKEEEHLNRLLLLRLTNPWSSMSVRDIIERIGSGKGTFNVPQLPQSRPRPTAHPYHQIPPPPRRPLPTSQQTYYSQLSQPRPPPEWSPFPPEFVPKHTLSSARPPDPDRLEQLSRPRMPKYVEEEIYSIHGPPKKIDMEVLERLTRPKKKVIRPQSAQKAQTVKKAKRPVEAERSVGKQGEATQEQTYEEEQEEMSASHGDGASDAEEGRRSSAGPPKTSFSGRYSRLSSTGEATLPPPAHELSTVAELSNAQEVQQLREAESIEEETQSHADSIEEAVAGDAPVHKVPSLIREEEEDGEQIEEDIVSRAQRTALPASVAASLANLTGSQVFDEALRRPLPGSVVDLAFKKEVSVVKEQVIQEVEAQPGQDERTASQIFDFAAAQPLPPSQAASLSRPSSAKGSRTDIGPEPDTARILSAPPSKPPSRATSANNLARSKPASRPQSAANLVSSKPASRAQSASNLAKSKPASRVQSTSNLAQTSKPPSRAPSSNNIARSKPPSRAASARSLRASRAGSTSALAKEDAANPVVQTIDIHQTSVTILPDASREVQEIIDAHSEVHQDGTVDTVEERVEKVTERSIVEVPAEEVGSVEGGTSQADQDEAARKIQKSYMQHRERVKHHEGDVEEGVQPADQEYGEDFEPETEGSAEPADQQYNEDFEPVGEGGEGSPARSQPQEVGLADDEQNEAARKIQRSYMHHRERVKDGEGGEKVSKVEGGGELGEGPPAVERQSEAQPVEAQATSETGGLAERSDTERDEAARKIQGAFHKHLDRHHGEGEGGTASKEEGTTQAQTAEETHQPEPEVPTASPQGATETEQDEAARKIQGAFHRHLEKRAGGGKEGGIDGASGAGVEVDGGGGTGAEDENGQALEAGPVDGAAGTNESTTHSTEEQEEAARKIQGAFHRHLEKREGDVSGGKAEEAPSA